MTYKITLAGLVVCETTWPPMAQAAWNRACRDRDGAQRGWRAALEKDGEVLADVVCETLRRPRWPDPTEPECDLRSVFKGLLQLLRDDDWNAGEIAEAMTTYGLPTTRARIDALRGSTQGKRTDVEPAELVVMLAAILNSYKKSDPATPHA